MTSTSSANPQALDELSASNVNSKNIAEPPFASNTPAIQKMTSNHDIDGSQIGSNAHQVTTNGADTGAATHQQKVAQRISFEDFLDINNIVFEWADSYDNKDWKRLSNILAPSMMVDYTIVGHGRIDNLPAVDFIAMMSSQAFLGDPLVRTQHLMGARKLEYISATEVIGHHQIRAAHLRYRPDGKTVETHGHGHSFINHWYKKIDGVWKLSGVCPKIYFNEGEFEKIFVDLKY